MSITYLCVSSFKRKKLIPQVDEFKEENKKEENFEVVKEPVKQFACQEDVCGSREVKINILLFIFKHQ